LNDFIAFADAAANQGLCDPVGTVIKFFPGDFRSFIFRRFPRAFLASISVISMSFL
jgi:hypothetical protein